MENFVVSNKDLIDPTCILFFNYFSFKG